VSERVQNHQHKEAAKEEKEAREENDGPIMAEVQEAFMRLI